MAPSNFKPFFLQREALKTHMKDMSKKSSTDHDSEDKTAYT
jgi:hypothetical protein